MAAFEEPNIVLYDIILDPAAFPMSPNPWKTRYALNFTNASYRTMWVPLPAITETRESLHLTANRRHADGSAFPTLPIIRDKSAPGQEEMVIGDSFDIALHLHTTRSKQLFPVEENWQEDGRAFNAFVDQLFSQHGAPLAGYYMPLDPQTAESDKATMLARFPGNMKWEDIDIPIGSEVRKKMLGDFETALNAKLAPSFPTHDKSGGGPFMAGREKPMYADFIVGGWLQFMRGCLPEWEQMRTSWSGGRWGRLFDALEGWAYVDGRDGVVPGQR